MEPGWRLAWLWGWRDLRGRRGGAFAGLRIALICLVLGVGQVAAVGGVRDTLQSGIEGQRRALLGGDLVVESGERLPPDLTALLARSGRTSQGMRTRSMLYAPDGGRMLVEVRAEDGVWPLVGHASVTRSVQPAPHQVLLEPLVARRLGLTPGQSVRLGSATFQFAGVLDSAPDSGGGITLAPTAMIRLSDVPDTALIQPGALLTWSLRMAFSKAPEQAAARALSARVTQQFPDQAWRIRDIRDAAPGLLRTVEEVGSFMGLIGLSALLLGGIGVSAGVRSWLETRRQGFAILRSIGAPSKVILQMVLLQLGVLCGGGIVAGAVLGAVVAEAVVHFGGSMLPVAPGAAVAVLLRPALYAAGAGVLTAFVFALEPVMSGVSVRPAQLLRADGAMRVLRGVAAAVVSGSLILLVFVVWGATDRRLALFFSLAVVLALVLFRGLAMASVAATRLIVQRRGATRAGITRLGLVFFSVRSGTASRMILALGLGLAGLSSVRMLDGAVQAQLDEVMPHQAPAFYFIDIQPSDLDRFDALVRGQPSVRAVQQMPSMRTRVVAVDGVPAAKVSASAATRWALRGDHGLTLADDMPPDTHLEAGSWWPGGYTGPPLLSLDAGLAEGWGAHVGSTVTLNVLGRSIDFRVASLRRVAWRSLRMNFAFIASPGLLSHAPHGYIATVSTDRDPAHDATLLQVVTDALPGVTGIRVADVLTTLSGLAGRLSQALGAMAFLMLISGLLVILTTVLTSRRQRAADAAVLRALGATDRQLTVLWVLECLGAGFVAGGGAAVFGSVVALLAMRYLLMLPMVFLPLGIFEIICGALAILLGVGVLSQRAVKRARPADLLRAR